MHDKAKVGPSKRERAAEEMRKYLGLSAYLFVCFVVVMLYEASLRAAGQPLYTLLTAALIKALVIGKFVLIGDMVGAGTRVAAGTLGRLVAVRTLSLLVVLALFKLIEEAVIGMVRGHGAGAALAEFFGQPALNLVAPLLLMALILAPLVAAVELSKALGHERVTHLFARETDGGPAPPQDRRANG